SCPAWASPHTPRTESPGALTAPDTPLALSSRTVGTGVRATAYCSGPDSAATSAPLPHGAAQSPRQDNASSVGVVPVSLAVASRSFHCAPGAPHFPQKFYRPPHGIPAACGPLPPHYGEVRAYTADT